MDKNMAKIARQLEGFEEVWKRVEVSKTADAATARGLKLMPKKNCCCCRPNRFTQGRR